MNAPASMPVMHQQTGAVSIPPTVIQFGNYQVQTTPYYNCNLHLAHNTEGQPVLCRLIRGNDANALARFNSREGPALFALRAAALGNICPCLVRILEQIDNPDTGDKLVVFQNLISGYQFTRLSLLMQQNPTGFQEQFAMSVFLQIAHAVMECHNAGVCVRDITPNSIFVYRHQVDGNIRISTVLADLSQAMVVPASGMISDRRGIPAYVSPEILQHASYNGYYADAWALGVLLHVLLTGRLPWPTSVTPAQLLFMITGATPTINLLDNIHVSQEARALVAGLMNRNLEQRLTVVNAIRSAAAILSMQYNLAVNATENKDKDPSSGAY
jgi:serine/threonine protein kinase